MAHGGSDDEIDPDAIVAQLAVKCGLIDKEKVRKVWKRFRRKDRGGRSLTEALRARELIDRRTADRIEIHLTTVLEELGRWYYGEVEPEERRLQQALREGLVSRSAIERAIVLQVSGQDRRPAATLLVARKLLDKAVAAQLTQALTSGSPQRIDQYELVRQLGRGAHGSVYLARDVDIDRLVALKFIRPELRATHDKWQRFLREARLLTEIQHPAVVRLLSLVADAKAPYMVLEHVDGPTLDGYLRSEPPRDAVMQVLVRAAFGLHAVHEHGVVHRDLKPSNILLDAQRRPRITDFGLARNDDDAGQDLTLPGEVVGTTRYMAPEQLARDSLTPATDVHAMGVILYRILTGEYPYDGSTDRQIYRRILMEDPVPPRRHDPTIRPQVEAVCLAALAKLPRDRPQSADAFGLALSQAMNAPVGHTLSGRRQLISADDHPAPPRATGWLRRLVGRLRRPGDP